MIGLNVQCSINILTYVRQTRDVAYSLSTIPVYIDCNIYQTVQFVDWKQRPSLNLLIPRDFVG